MANQLSGEQIERMHHEVLLALIGDFLSWGGSSQLNNAKLALSDLSRRLEARAKDIKHQDAHQASI